MPLYDYQCTKCKRVVEVRHGFNETHDGVCPSCGGPLTRVFNPASIVFKGSGFYITDSRAAPSSESKPTSAPTATPAAVPAKSSSDSGSSKSASDKGSAA